MTRPSSAPLWIPAALVAAIFPQAPCMAEENPPPAAGPPVASEQQSLQASPSLPTLAQPGVSPAAQPSGVAGSVAAPGPDATDPPPAITQAVPPVGLLGFGLVPHHYDEVGYPESLEGLLIVENDPTAGPITMVQGQKPHYLEAQFVNVQRDAVWLARQGAVVDVLPNGAPYEIPYGYGAVKRSLAATTLIEAQVQPHFSDNQKSYQLFPLQDFYLGATLSLVGLRADFRYVEKERYVGHVQAGVNLASLAGAEFNRTFGAFAVPIVVGGGIRYPSVISIVGSNWTTGAEVILGLGSVDKDPDTAGAIALPGLFHEVEWAFQRDVEVTDFRTDPRPYNYGVQSLYAKIGAYPDFLGGATKSLLFDLHVGYRYNFKGPSIPHHQFKETRVTYASERYVQRKLEEERRRQELEEVRERRGQDPNAPVYPGYSAPGTTPAQPPSAYPQQPLPPAPR